MCIYVCVLKPQTSCLCLPNAELTAVLPHPTSYMGTGDLNWGSSASAASALFHVLPPPPNCFLITVPLANRAAWMLCICLPELSLMDSLPHSLFQLVSCPLLKATALLQLPASGLSDTDLLSSVQPKKSRAPGGSDETVPRRSWAELCFSFPGLLSRKEWQC